MDVMKPSAMRHSVAARTGRLVLLEGRDAAGKSTAARWLATRFDGRVVSLPPPDAVERRFYFRRWLRQLPERGELVIWDRSWYNRAGIERVMGFASPLEVEGFLRAVPEVERGLVAGGISLVKIYLAVSKTEQARRLEAREAKGKLSRLDRAALSHWDHYSVAEEEMVWRTSTAHAPWTVIDADDMPRSRVEAARIVERAAGGGRVWEAA